EPGLLNPAAQCGRADRLDRRDLGLANTIDRGDAGSNRNAVDMHRASAAQRHATPEFRAGQTEHIAQDPEQRRVAVNIHTVCLRIDLKGEDHGYTSCTSALRASPSPMTGLRVRGRSPEAAFSGPLPHKTCRFLFCAIASRANKHPGSPGSTAC